MNKLNQSCPKATLLCVAFFVFSSAQLLTAQFFADFEVTEGFVDNQSPNDGATVWGGSGSAGAALYATDEEAYTGSQSLAVENGASTNYFTLNDDNFYDVGASEVSFYLKNPATTFASGATVTNFDVYYNTDSASAGSRVSFGLVYGVLETDPLRVYYSQNGVSSDGYGVFSGLSPSVLDDWAEVVVDFDFMSGTKTVSLTVAGVASTPRTLAAAAGEDSHLTKVRFNASTSGTGVSYVDNISVIPEPSQVALVMGSLLFIGTGLCRRRPHLRG